MGKKSKKPKAITNGTDSMLEPTTVETVPKKNVGLSEKSKKIKKKKKDKSAVAATVEEVTEAVGNGELVVTKPKKKKKNKDKPAPVAEGQPAVKSEVAQNGDGAKHKKKKKNKRSKNGGEQPTDVPDQKKLDKKAKKLSKKMDNKAPEKAKSIPADIDVVTSESESEAEKEADESTAMDKVNQSVLRQHSGSDKDSSDDEDGSKEGKKSDSAKEDAKKSTRNQGPEYSVFVGNLPTAIKKGTIKKLFMPYGRILTIRFRTSDGVSLFKKKDRKEAKSLICYVRFSSKEEAVAACAMNGKMVEENRIRVSLQSQKHLGHIASTVFVGNIHRKTTDNELYDFFGSVGEIEYVRQISDKGIGYVCFKKGVPIAKALKLNQQMLNGRPLRISKVDPNLQHKRKNKKGNLVDKRRPLPATGAAKRVAQKSPQEKSQPTDFHGTVAKKQTGGKKQKHFKKGGGAEHKKKILAQKLAAAAGKPKKFR